MKLIHISDLHIGKKLKGFSLIEDQKHILNQIIDVAKEEKIDGLIIAGDIYDVQIPQIEAVNLFDEFISKINEMGIACYIVSGNHDNIHRISFASNIMSKSNIYVAKKYNGNLIPIKHSENINIWLIPFIRPFEIREFYNDFESSSYEEMMKTILNNVNIDDNKINILVAHQFVTCNGKEPERSESETTSLGTIDNIDVSVFEKFDYVALGHIHKSQAMGRQTVRYSGSPLKYSFSEKNDKKSIVVLDINDKNINLKYIDYNPLREMKEIIGYYDEIIKNDKSDEFVRIVLKDEDFIVDVKHKLESIYSNIMEIEYDNLYTASNNSFIYDNELKELTPLELFRDFYCMQNSRNLSEEQENIVREIFKSIDMEENAQ